MKLWKTTRRFWSAIQATVEPGRLVWWVHWMLGFWVFDVTAASSGGTRVKRYLFWAEVTNYFESPTFCLVVQRLPPLIQERNEKLKEEMISKCLSVTQHLLDFLTLPVLTHLCHLQVSWRTWVTWFWGHLDSPPTTSRSTRTQTVAPTPLTLCRTRTTTTNDITEEACPFGSSSCSSVDSGAAG